MNNENLSEKDSNQLSIDELLEKEKNKGTLTQNELVSMIDDNECDLDQIDKLYEDLEILNLESADGGLEQNEFTEEIKNEIERYGSAEDMEKMLASEGLAIDDPVRMYLKEIGKVPLLIGRAGDGAGTENGRGRRKRQAGTGRGKPAAGGDPLPKDMWARVCPSWT